jgi:3-deoxy-D-manno-octulosonic-acid transferase
MTLGLYTLLLRLALPLVLLRLYWRSLKSPAYRRRSGERLALGPPAPKAEIWIHAVSVGEVQAAEPLIRQLLLHDSARSILVTTTTPTGAARLRELLGERAAHRYTPYDLPGVLRRFLRQVTPRLLIVMETEIWPNTLARCERQGIPVVLANARLSERSARGYARIAGLTRASLTRFALIAAQSDDDARRFLTLGAEPLRVRVTGSIKFDLRQPEDLPERARNIRQMFGLMRPVWVAASTRDGEEEAVLAAHRQIRARIPNALLVLVPRHPERFERVAALVGRQGFAMARRSRQETGQDDTEVFLGDTMGELPVFIAAADAAFIGGSLVPTGGHNLLEAAAAGVPVAIGPHTFNFAAITDLLIAEGGAVRVADADSLAEIMIDWLSDTNRRSQVGECGRTVVERNRGALDRLLALIEAQLDPAQCPNGAT